MAMEAADLDRVQAKYEVAVHAWMTTIRHEGQLASVNHSEAQIDRWEIASTSEEQTRKTAKEADKAYEGALRQEFFSFQLEYLLAVDGLLVG